MRRMSQGHAPSACSDQEYWGRHAPNPCVVRFGQAFQTSAGRRCFLFGCVPRGRLIGLPRMAKCDTLSGRELVASESGRGAGSTPASKMQLHSVFLVGAPLLGNLRSAAPLRLTSPSNEQWQRTPGLTCFGCSAVAAGPTMAAVSPPMCGPRRLGGGLASPID